MNEVLTMAADSASPSWARILVPSALEVLALLVAAGLGARLQAGWTRKQTLQLHRTQREQEALLRFLDLLARIDITMRRSMPAPHDPTIHWSEAVEGVGAKMLREHPGVTWDRSDTPDEEFYQWGRVVGAILDAEEEWRGHLAGRIARPSIATIWAEVLNTGAPLGLKSSGATGQQLAALHPKVLFLMDEIRKLT